MDILEEIVAHKRLEVDSLKNAFPIGELEHRLESVVSIVPPSLSASLLASPYGIISEFKRRSPSKGWIKESAEATQIPLSYQQAGASALSILTDEKYFGGKDEDIAKARQSGVTLPILYKNFIIDEYQLFQARLCGASAVLLIAACLSKNECKSLLRMAHDLDLEVLLEMHSEPELEYTEIADIAPKTTNGITSSAVLCGINNRHLGSFVTDVETSFRLASLLPQEAVKVSESGISSPKTVMELREAGFRGFLIGEHFMRSEQPGDALKGFISSIH